jgi:hypothetical protein
MGIRHRKKEMRIPVALTILCLLVFSAAIARPVEDQETQPTVLRPGPPLAASPGLIGDIVD